MFFQFSFLPHVPAVSAGHPKLHQVPAVSAAYPHLHHVPAVSGGQPKVYQAPAASGAHPHLQYVPPVDAAPHLNHAQNPPQYGVHNVFYLDEPRKCQELARND